MKKFISLLLAISVLFCIPTVAFAHPVEKAQEAPLMTLVCDDGIMPLSSINVISQSTIIKVSLLTATMTGSVACASGTTKIRIRLILQKQDSNGGYQPVEEWSKEFYDDVATFSAKKTVSPFSKYRVFATYTTYSNRGTQTIDAYDYQD